MNADSIGQLLTDLKTACDETLQFATDTVATAKRHREAIQFADKMHQISLELASGKRSMADSVKHKTKEPELCKRLDAMCHTKTGASRKEMSVALKWATTKRGRLEPCHRIRSSFARGVKLKSSRMKPKYTAAPKLNRWKNICIQQPLPQTIGRMLSSVVFKQGHWHGTLVNKKQ